MDDLAALTAKLDEMITTVKAAIPDADYIIVGRERQGEDRPGDPATKWVIEFYLPRRNKAFRVMKNQIERILGVHGDTFEDALENAVRHACYHRTGKFTEE